MGEYSELKPEGQHCCIAAVKNQHGSLRLRCQRNRTSSSAVDATRASPVGWSEAAQWCPSTRQRHDWLCRIPCGHCSPSVVHPWRARSQRWWNLETNRVRSITWTQSNSMACNSVRWVVHICCQSKVQVGLPKQHGTAQRVVVYIQYTKYDLTWVLRIVPVVDLLNIVVTLLLVVTECHLTGMVHLYLYGGDKVITF